MVMFIQNIPQNPNDRITIYKTFKPLYMVLSVLGLFPCSIKQSKCGIVVIQKSVYINALSAISINLAMCSFLAFHIQHIYTATEDNTLTETNMTQLNYIVELINLTIFCIVAYFSAYYYRSTYVDTLAKASTHINTGENFDGILRRLRMKINVAIGVLLIVTILQMCVNCTRQDSIFKIVLVTFTFILPQTIQFISIWFYYVLVLMIVSLLKVIKEHMYSIIRHRNTSIIKVQSRKQVSIKEIEFLYVKTFEMKRDVNKAFQAPILISLMQCFHSMVSESHIIYHGVIHMKFNVHEIVNCGIWVICQILKVYVLANSGSMLNIETMKIGRLLHNIPTEKQDLRFLFEIQHFSTLMKYQGNELTVFGYFPLDSTLIFKVIASAAMYLIILVQFDNKI